MPCRNARRMCQSITQRMAMARIRSRPGSRAEDVSRSFNQQCYSRNPARPLLLFLACVALRQQLLILAAWSFLRDQGQQNCCCDSRIDFAGSSSTLIVALIFQNEQVFRPGGVKGKVGDCISSRSKNRIVQFSFQVLRVFSKHYLVTRASRVRWWWCHSG